MLGKLATATAVVVLGLTGAVATLAAATDTTGSLVHALVVRAGGRPERGAGCEREGRSSPSGRNAASPSGACSSR